VHPSSGRPSLDPVSPITAEIIGEFVAESYESLDRMSTDLVALEQDRTNPETLSSIFRTMHTVKGTCGFLSFAKLEAIAHAAEDLLSLIRDGVLEMTPDVVTALLDTSDAMREVLAHVERDVTEGPRDYRALVARLETLAQGERPAPTNPVDDVERLVRAAAVGTGRSLAGAADLSVRVDVKLLDSLMNVVGELVLTRNQILQQSEAVGDKGLLASAQRLNVLTADLQDAVMKTRMQPLGTLLSSLPRLVRDLAVSCHKQVQLDVEGHETELDRTLIEAVKDPLTHLVRNALDHGIEAPALRVASGKPGQGRIAVRAFHQGGHVNIEITDDGAGIDVDQVRRLAVQRGLIDAEQAQAMSNHEAAALIFAPGISTAPSITMVSGRGVGMDVVRTNIERIGGTVDVRTQRGVGTTILMRIPLTLAIMPALIVTAGGEQYAIPQVNLLEVARVDGKHASPSIEMHSGVPTCRLRGRRLPLVELGVELGDASRLTGALSNGDPIDIVALQVGERQFGLMVESVLDTEEIVVKALGRLFSQLSTFAGATIMGDGQVALILDVAGLAQRARVGASAQDTPLESNVPGEQEVDSASADTRLQRLLVMGVGGGRRMALPLELVDRIEGFSPGVIERTGDLELVQYRDEIVPLARLSGFLGVEPARATDEVMPVVLARIEEQTIGLVVDEIVDIVEGQVSMSDHDERAGVAGSATISGRETAVIDLDQLAERLHDLQMDAVAP
jgi:two-component system, chemotaxis family, sensor kinase CheA